MQSVLDQNRKSEVNYPVPATQVPGAAAGLYAANKRVTSNAQKNMYVAVIS
jgi:hypothetical protein